MRTARLSLASGAMGDNLFADAYTDFQGLASLTHHTAPHRNRTPASMPPEFAVSSTLELERH